MKTGSEPASAAALPPGGEHRTRIILRHLGWRDQTSTGRFSCYCWAMYLRILRRNLEFGEFVPYEKRLDN